MSSTDRPCSISARTLRSPRIMSCRQLVGDVFVGWIRPLEIIGIKLDDGGDHGQRRSIRPESIPVNHVNLEPPAQVVRPLVECRSKVYKPENSSIQSLRLNRCSNTSRFQVRGSKDLEGPGGTRDLQTTPFLQESLGPDRLPLFPQVAY